MNFFRKKKEHAQPAVSVSTTHVNEALDNDGFVHLNVEGNDKSQAPLPYSVTTPAEYTIKVTNTKVPEVKVTDEIPFQFSPVYNHIWFADQAETSGSSTRVKAVDWDALSYDFKLEKSVTQS